MASALPHCCLLSVFNVARETRPNTGYGEVFVHGVMAKREAHYLPQADVITAAPAQGCREREDSLQALRLELAARLRAAGRVRRQGW